MFGCRVFEAQVHPQPETYWGHVNPNGPRACYDEAKRLAETLMVAYHKQEEVPIRIARIFNTFGPRMHMNDGRVVSNFVLQALQNQSITVSTPRDCTMRRLLRAGLWQRQSDTLVPVR
jgi:UDP-glucuronate decarboxylase